MFHESKNARQKKQDLLAIPFLFSSMGNVPVFFGEDPGHIYEELHYDNSFSEYTR